MSNLDFLTAKVRAIRSKIYEGEKLYRLCQLQNIEDLAKALAPDEPGGDAISLQRYLTARHVIALHKLLQWLDGWEAEMFLWMLRRYQVENLRVILRCWATNADKSFLGAYTVKLPEELDLPTEVLMKSPDMESLVMTIPLAQLREGALLGLGEFEESQRLFFIEAGIDKAYFTELNRIGQQCKTEAQPAVNKLVNLELDIYNTMLVLRGLFNYSVRFNKIRVLLAPFGREIGMKALEQLRNAANLDDAAEAIPAALLGRQAPPTTADQAETAMWSTLYRTANRQYYTSVLDFGTIAAFYYIKRVELSNLIKISECIRYGQKGGQMRQKLIRLPPAAPERAG